MAPKKKKSTFERGKFSGRLVSIDTEVKYYEDRRVADPAYKLIWEISVVPLDNNLELVGRDIYTKLLKPKAGEVHITKLKKLTYEVWKNAKQIEGKPFQDELYEKLNGKVWIGWSIIRADIPHIKTIFKLRSPPKPLAIFDAYVWTDNIGFKKISKVPNLTLDTLSLHMNIRKQSHRAQDDAFLCIEVFKGVVKVIHRIKHERNHSSVTDKALKILSMELS